MTWQVIITVFTLGGIGAVARGIIFMILAKSAGLFPAGTVIVNALAAFLGGFLGAAGLPVELNAALLTGLIGGIGTLSAIPGNIMDLYFDRGFKRLAVYLALTMFLGLGAASAGIGLGKLMMRQQQLQLDRQQMLFDAMKSGIDAHDGRLRGALGEYEELYDRKIDAPQNRDGIEDASQDGPQNQNDAARTREEK